MDERTFLVYIEYLHQQMDEVFYAYDTTDVNTYLVLYLANEQLKDNQIVINPSTHPMILEAVTLLVSLVNEKMTSILGSVIHTDEYIASKYFKISFIPDSDNILVTEHTREVLQNG